jgi:hypothetical protein
VLGGGWKSFALPAGEMNGLFDRIVWQKHTNLPV